MVKKIYFYNLNKFCTIQINTCHQEIVGVTRVHGENVDNMNCLGCKCKWWQSSCKGKLSQGSGRAGFNATQHWAQRSGPTANSGCSAFWSVELSNNTCWQFVEHLDLPHIERNAFAPLYGSSNVVAGSGCGRFDMWFEVGGRAATLDEQFLNLLVARYSGVE